MYWTLHGLLGAYYLRPYGGRGPYLYLAQGPKYLNPALPSIYNIVHGLMDVDSRLLTVREESNTRGGALKLFKPQCQNNVRSHSFACRNVNTWNSQPEHFRCATTVAVFKRLINNYTFDVDRKSVV